MDFITILEKINGYVWGNGLIFLILSVGLAYTFRLGFVQLRFLPYILRGCTKTENSRSEGISQYKTICMSLGTAMGTGNITGVASAIAVGGAGAVFWMWISAFLGMAVVYAENYLSGVFSRKGGSKGPMAYMEYGLGLRPLALIYAVFCTVSAIGMGGMVQVSSFRENLTGCTDISCYIISLLVFITVFVTVKGGAGRISGIAQLLLPVVSVSYIIICSAVIIRFRSNILPAFEEIFSRAFSFTSAAGGITGFAVSKAVSVGLRRGIFSNEAGLGSSPILHSASENCSPSVQGMWSVFEVFFDTIVCCTLTALTLITASNGGCISISEAISHILGDNTSLFLTVSIGIFAFCTIIGWYFCGETAFTYLTGNRKKGLFSIIFSLFSALGAIISVDAVWALSDIFNGAMVLINLLALILLFRHVKRE